MINPCYDESIFNVEVRVKSKLTSHAGGMIENHNGDTMLVAETITIDFEEEIVTSQENPHLKIPLTFKSAMWMGIGFVGVALGGAWAMYTHLDNKLETYRSGTEARIEAARASLDGKIDSLGSETRAHFEAARVESKADNATITTQLQTISNSLSELNGKVSKDK
ncbi:MULTISPECIES: hypothetical protein [Enterobacteriaceae]|uniref:hypothetical protein n=1 Tax=Enterobacteriaceae TaxID=543 RepID=UPI001C714C1D|nr:hypothetical protein [Citrobacter freundii]